MITIYKIENEKVTSNGGLILAEFRGLSTDTKPTVINETDKIENGSTFVEIDTGKNFMYDAENKEWKEVSSGDSANSNIYSTTETQIGTYLGKPLYRKVIQLTAEEYDALAPGSGRRTLPIPTLAIDRLLTVVVSAKYNDGTKVCEKSYPSHGVTTGSTGSYEIGSPGVEDDNLNLFVGPNIFNGLTDTIDIIIEYTKTTD